MLKIVSQSRQFGGVLTRYSHLSRETKCEMVFSIFKPRQAEFSRCPVLWFLSGLTCTDQNFCIKSGAQKKASELGLVLVVPDTSPRGTEVPDDESYDLGQGAGFYLDATKSPYSKNFRMYSYLVDELPELLKETQNYIDFSLQSISGHSMGGMGALILAFRNPTRFASVSAFSPICNTSSSPWGRKCHSHYLNTPEEAKDYNPCELLETRGPFGFPILCDTGSADEYKKDHLFIEDLTRAGDAAKQENLENRVQEGYDHSYFFVSSFIDEHLEFHAKHLRNKKLEEEPREYENRPVKGSITCRAAVCHGPGEDLKVEEITVEPPKKGEVRIKVLCNSLCHTDIYAQSGEDPEGVYPSILGHEGVAVVESCGDGVISVKVNDLVVPCYTPQCAEPSCIFCQSSKTNLCPAIRSTQGKGVMPDGTTRFHLKDGSPVYHFMGCSTFSEYTVVSEISIAKINPRANPLVASLFGCGVATGLGAVWNTCKVERGATVAVFGLGAVGLSVIQAAKISGASKICGIDINPKKASPARALGMTDFVNAKDLESRKKLGDLAKWGFDYTFDCTGNVEVMRQALEIAHRGWGVSCVIGVAGAGKEISTRPFQLVTGRRWVGTAFGGWKSREAVPRLIEESMRGELQVDHYVTHRFQGIDKYNDAIQALHSGDCLRAVVCYVEI